MLARTRKTDSQGPAGTEAEARRPAVPSLISADVTFKGDLVSEGDVQLDGTVEGDVRAKTLTIGLGARVQGEVVAEHVHVCGTVEGVLRAERVDLAATAVLKGDVMHASVSVEEGARLDGKIACVEDPRRTRGAGLDTSRVRAELEAHAARREASRAAAKPEGDAPEVAAEASGENASEDAAEAAAPSGDRDKAKKAA